MHSDKETGFLSSLCTAWRILEKTRFLGFYAQVILYPKVCATIEERSINPTDEQAQACLRLCQILSNYYWDIQLLRFDPESREVYIFVRNELQIMVFPSGNWSFLDETQL